MGIVWDANQNRYVVTPDGQAQTPAQAPAASPTQPTQQGSIVWDATQNKYVVKGSQTTTQPSQTSSTGGNLVSNFLSGAIDKAKKIGTELKNPSNYPAIAADFVRGVGKGAAETGANVAKIYKYLNPESQVLSKTLDQNKSKIQSTPLGSLLYAGARPEESLQKVADKKALQPTTETGKDIVSPVAEFVAPSLVVPEAEGAGLLSRAASFAVQSQLIYNPTTDGKNELQGRFVNSLASFFPYLGFEAAVKPVFSAMKNMASAAADKFLGTATQQVTDAVNNTVTDLTKKGFQISNQSILDTVKGTQPITPEFRLFIQNVGDNLPTFLKDQVIPYPKGVFKGLIPEESKAIEGQLTKLPSLTDSTVKSELSSYLTQAASDIAYGKATRQDVNEGIKAFTNELDKRGISQTEEKSAKYLSGMVEYMRTLDDHNAKVVQSDIKQSLVDRVANLGLPNFAMVKGKLALMSKKIDDSEKLLQKVLGKNWDSYMQTLRDAGLVKNEEDFVNLIRDFPTKKDLSIPKFTVVEPKLDIAVPEKGTLASPVERFIRATTPEEAKAAFDKLEIANTGKTTEDFRSSSVENILDKNPPQAEADLQLEKASQLTQAEEIYKAIEKAGKPEFKAFQSIKEAIINPLKAFKSIVQSLYPAYFTPKTVQNAVIGNYQQITGDYIKFLNTKSGYLDLTFKGIEKFFNQYNKKDQIGFMVYAQSGEAGNTVNQFLRKDLTVTEKELESLLIKNTPDTLKDIDLIDAVRKGFDSIFDMISTLPAKYQTDYVENYFRGLWEKPDKALINNLVRKFSTSIIDSGFTKQKYWDFLVQGLAEGSTLRISNPVGLMRNELENVLLIKSQVDSVDRLLNLNTVAQDLGHKELKFAALKDEAPADFVSSGITGLSDYMFEPNTAKLINALYSPSIIKKNPIGSLTYNLAITQRGIQLMLPVYHFMVMTSLSLHDTTGLSPVNFLNPVSRTLLFSKAKSSFEKGFTNDLTKAYEEYVSIGGDTLMRNRSYEQEGIEGLASGILTAFNKVGEKSGFLKPLVGVTGKTLMLPTKMSDAIFEHYIPAQKFGSFMEWNRHYSAKFGRELTTDEKRALIIKLQNPYGEMNESLFGRSRTTQQGLRLIFRAPGFREGNFRFIFDTLNIKDPMNTAERRILLNGLATTFVLATAGTLAMTGKLPDYQSSLKKGDVYDFFTVKTGMKDANGKNLVLDLPRLFNLKDYYRILGSTVTGHVADAAAATTSIISSALSPNVTEATTLTDVLAGKQTTNYLGQPVSPSEAFLSDIKPIPLSQFQQAKARGGDVSPFVQYLTTLGLPLTTSQVDQKSGKLGSNIYNLNQQRSSLQSQWKKATGDRKIQLKQQIDELDKTIGDAVKQLSDNSGQSKGVINKKYRIPRQAKQYEYQ